jgi:LysR family glycine cleavage system transcriptional activator
MPPRPPSLLALRAFETAARRLSFTEAARELHISQAAVSRHIRALEKDAGRELFRRLHRAVELTDAGRRLASELSGAFLQINRAVEAVRGVRAQRLRITAEPAFASRWLVPRLGGFSLSHPQIELEVETSDEFRTLGRDADLAIRYISVGAALPRGGARRLFSMEGVPVTAGVRPRPTKWRRDDAVRSFRLLHDDNGTAWKSWFATAGLDGFERAQHLYFTDYSLAIAAAERSQGVALGTPAFIANELRTGRLVQLGHTRVPFGQYFLLESRERSSAPLREVFVQWLMGQAARSADGSTAERTSSRG